MTGGHLEEEHRAEHSNVLKPGTERNSSHTGSQQREETKFFHKNKTKQEVALKNFDPDNNDHNS